MEVVNVCIVRQNNHIVRDVMDYEMPVLEAMHEQVIEKSRRKLKDNEFRERVRLPEGMDAAEGMTDADVAFENLKARYATRDGEEAINSVYRNANEFKRLFKKAA
jgi:hypothetical protein